MNRPPRDSPSSDDSHRVRETYESYRRSPRKRRAWEADNPGNVAIRAELRERAFAASEDELSGEGHVVDLGCGTGWWLAELAGSGVAKPRLHGIDLLPERVQAASAAVPGADVRAADAGRLPFPDDHFTLVTMFTLLSSLPDRPAVARALSEARRVLAPGGALLIYEPRIANPLNRHTLFISRRMLRAGLAGEPDEVPLTVLPPLSRRLGRRAESLYPRLARIGLLLTHRLAIHRELMSNERSPR